MDNHKFNMTDVAGHRAGHSLKSVLARLKHEARINTGDFDIKIKAYFDKKLAHYPEEERVVAIYFLRQEVESDNLSWGGFMAICNALGFVVEMSISTSVTRVLDGSPLKDIISDQPSADTAKTAQEIATLHCKLSAPLRNFNIPYNYFRALQDAGVHYMGDLIGYTKTTFLRVVGMDGVAYELLTQLLRRYDLKVEMDALGWNHAVGVTMEKLNIDLVLIQSLTPEQVLRVTRPDPENLGGLLLNDIAVLNLPVRVENILRNVACVESVAHLIQYNIESLLKVPGLGELFVSEICVALKKINLQLREI